jgi:hypothetical protein
LCDGNDPACRECRGTGFAEIVGCPAALVTEDVRDALRTYDFMQNGMLPMPGGWLDQTEIMLNAVDFLAAECNDCEAYERSKRAVNG